MIDFKNEIKKYNLFEIDNDINTLFDETKLVIDGFNSTIKRFAKEQNQTNMQVEEIVCILDEQKENHELISDLKNSISKSNQDNMALVKGVIKVMDQLEDLYRYSVKNYSDGWSGQIKLLWENVTNDLLAIGITRVDGENSTYNAAVNNIVSTKTIENLPEGIVLEVLKSGYLYKSEVLRRSQVIVNMNA